MQLESEEAVVEEEKVMVTVDEVELVGKRQEMPGVAV